MAWITMNDDEQEFVNQLETYPDRVVGLVAPVMVDDALETAIKARWASLDEKFFGELFDDGRPLGNFGTRVKIGYAIRLYGDDAYHDLIQLNKIRNAFAHKLEAKNFDYQSIRDRANHLRLPNKFTILSEWGKDEIRSLFGPGNILDSPPCWPATIRAATPQHQERAS